MIANQSPSSPHCRAVGGLTAAKRESHTQPPGRRIKGNSEVKNRIVRQIPAVLFSLIFGLASSSASVAVALKLFTSEGSDLLTVLLWNFYMANLLARKGMLPVCVNCELVTLFEIIFWAFIVGVIGYASIFFGFLQLHRKLSERLPS